MTDQASPADVAFVLSTRAAHLRKLQGAARTTGRVIALGARADEVAQMHDQLAARGVAAPRSDDERSDIEVRVD